jgi:hypothetical protein
MAGQGEPQGAGVAYVQMPREPVMVQPQMMAYANTPPASSAPAAGQLMMPVQGACKCGLLHRSACVPRSSTHARCPDRSGPLPPGWEEKVSQQYAGRKYYFNASTNETAWERPRATSLMPGQVMPGPTGGGGVYIADTSSMAAPAVGPGPVRALDSLTLQKKLKPWNSGGDELNLEYLMHEKKPKGAPLGLQALDPNQSPVLDKIKCGEPKTPEYTNIEYLLRLIAPLVKRWIHVLTEYKTG